MPETKLKTNWDKILANRGIKAIRQGLISLIPALMVGAFSLVLRSFPIDAYQSFITTWSNGLIFTFLSGIYNITFGLLSLYMAAAIAYQYALLGKNNAPHSYFGSVMSSIACFILLTGPTSLSADTLGPKGMFIAIISAIGSSVIYNAIFSRMHPLSLLADGSDIRLNTAIQSIIPLVITLTVFVVADRAILLLSGEESIHALMLDGANKLFEGIGSKPLSGLLFVFLSSVLWFFGIHGSDVLEGVSASVFAPATAINEQLVAIGQQPTEIFTKPFFDVFVLMGGCGSAMCLLFALLIFSKRRSSRSLAGMAALPMIFNINEIMIFGLPVIYNPTLLIPFLGVPLVCCGTTYIAMATGMVPLISSSVEWTTPVLIGGYVATGSWTGIALQAFNLILGTLIYCPFVLRYDREKVITVKRDYDDIIKTLQESEADRHPILLTELLGSDGSFAKAIASDLRAALNKGELKLYYQPQYRLDGSCLGAEALLRWKHPLLGFIYPPLVFKLAEETGFLEELEKSIFISAVSDASELFNRTGARLTISVNVTGSSIQSPTFEAFLLEESKKIPKNVCICIELTEQTALKFDDELHIRFARLREAGYLLAIDDFSMGNTSLQYLQDNHFDMVKLDGKLVRESEENPRCLEIIASLVHLAESLGFKVLAEYVGTVQLRDMLANVGCCMYQGWLYSPALPLDKLTEKLSETDNIKTEAK